jgi:hypothetical protein
MQKKPAVSCSCFQTFPSHCISLMTEDFDLHFVLYHTHFWNKFIVNEIQSITHLELSAVQIVIYADLAMFMPPSTCILFIATLLHSSSSF